MRASEPGVLGYKSAHLFTTTSVLKLKILFQISSDEKVLFFGAKDSGQSFGLFRLPLYFIRSCYYNDLHSLLYPTDYRSWSASSFCLTFVLTALAVSPWGLFVQTQRVGGFTFPFPLTVAYHVTIRTNGIFTTWNPSRKILWDFEIQTDHLISVKRPDLVIVNKKIVLFDQRVKLKWIEKWDKCQDIARELKN